MKKILLAMFTLAAGISLSVSNLYAYPVMGTVDPGFSSGYDLKTTTSGSATYNFKNSVSVNDYSMIFLILEFEKAVFEDSTSLVSIPAGWFSSTSDEGDRVNLYLSSSPGLPGGGTLSFQVNYFLKDNALALDWEEGDYWEQGFTAYYNDSDGNLVTEDTLFGTYPKGDGGSTSPIPEPGTMVMLGISILSLAGYGKMRLKK